MKTKSKEMAKEYVFTRRKIGDEKMWVIVRGSLTGVARTRGRALINLLNQTMRSAERENEKTRKSEAKKGQKI